MWGWVGGGGCEGVWEWVGMWGCVGMGGGVGVCGGVWGWVGGPKIVVGISRVQNGLKGRSG